MHIRTTGGLIRRLVAGATASVVIVGMTVAPARAVSSAGSTPPHVVSIDGVDLSVATADFPNATFTGSAAGVGIQTATANSLNPYQSVSITAVPFGHTDPTLLTTEEQQTAHAGAAGQWLAAFQRQRAKAGGKTSTGPSADLLGHPVRGLASQQTIAIAGGAPRPVDTVEWVTESGQRLWVVQMAEDHTLNTAGAFGTNLTVISANPGAATTLPSAVRSAKPAGSAGTMSAMSAPASFPLALIGNWNGQVCDAGHNTGSYSEGNWKGLDSCGPSGGFYSVNFPNAVHGWGVGEWQCVELSMRYMYLRFGIHAYPANGDSVVDHFPDDAPTYSAGYFNPSPYGLIKQANGVAGKYPHVGDVISENIGVDPGHTAVVSDVSNFNTSTGTGSITVIQENWADAPYSTYQITTPWVISAPRGGSNLDWLHDPSADTPPTRASIVPGSLGTWNGSSVVTTSPQSVSGPITLTAQGANASRVLWFLGTQKPAPTSSTGALSQSDSGGGVSPPHKYLLDTSTLQSGTTYWVTAAAFDSANVNQVDATSSFQITVSSDKIYAMPPDKSAVSVYNGSGSGPGAWTAVGGAAVDLYAGGLGMFATNPNDGSINAYNSATGQWARIGGPGAMYAVSNNHLYGLSSDHSAVSVWNGTYGGGAGDWTVIGGAATAIYAGGLGLFATNPNDGSINQYRGTPGSWSMIGGPGATYAVGDTHLYGLSSDHGAVSVWNGTYGGGAGDWTVIGGAASEIAAT